MKPVKILYFITDVEPTPRERHTATQMRAHVVFRLASVVPNEKHALEECDGVMGAVPPIYAAKYPPSEIAIAKRDRELEALLIRAGETVGEGPREPGTPAENEADEPSEAEELPPPPAMPAKPQAAVAAPQQPKSQPPLAKSAAQHVQQASQAAARNKPARPSQPPPAAAKPGPFADKPQGEPAKGDSPVWKPNT